MSKGLTPVGRIGDIDAGRIELGMSARDLWVGYFAMGGNGTQADVDGWLSGAMPLPAREHNLLAQTLNERFTDIGQNHPVAYSDGF
jgi:hypothetical protein